MATPQDKRNDAEDCHGDVFRGLLMTVMMLLMMRMMMMPCYLEVDGIVMMVLVLSSIMTISVMTMLLTTTMLLLRFHRATLMRFACVF